MDNKEATPGPPPKRRTLRRRRRKGSKKPKAVIATATRRRRHTGPTATKRRAGTNPLAEEAIARALDARKRADRCLAWLVAQVDDWKARADTNVGALLMARVGVSKEEAEESCEELKLRCPFIDGGVEAVVRGGKRCQAGARYEPPVSRIRVRRVL